MKKLFIPFVFILLAVTKIFSQSPIPAIDSKGYEDMKHQGLLLKEPFISHPNLFTPTLNDFKKSDAIHKMKRLEGGNPPTPASTNTCSCYIPPDSSYINAFPSGTDDGSTSLLSIPFNFCLYGTNYTSLYINNNGNVSFGTSYFTFSSSPFPDSNFVMVAPFWSDVDTRGTGSVLYKITPTAVFVNWIAVGYYDQKTDKVNTFQLIITNGSDPILSIGNNIAFCYGDMQWTTGDASQGVNGFGGTPATVGVNQGGSGGSYIQIGRFDQPGLSYSGPYSNNSGVDWLDNKSFYFNACASVNIPPIASGLNSCDTIRMCHLSDTLILSGLFLSPEINQNTTVTVNLNGTPNATVLNITNGNTATAQVEVIFTSANVGDNIITFTATDDGLPIASTVINTHLFMDASNPPPNFNPYITGSLTFCQGDSTTLSVSPTTYDSYVWNTGSVNTSINVDSSGQYWVTSSKNGCYKTTIVDAAEHLIHTPVIIGSLDPCNVVNNLSIDSLIYTSYNWSNGSTNDSITVGAGTYTVSVIDTNGCGYTSLPVTILPYLRTLAGTDTILCLSQSIQLNATGGNTFTWSVISGPALVVGTNFSCNPCANPIATPTATTVYQVKSNLNGTCINKDTVTVTVVPNFTNTITQSEIITCLLQPPIQLNITTAPIGTYSYVWSPSTYLNNSTITNPIANITVPGIHTFTATVSSTSGCVKKDSATITITPSYAPDPIAYGSSATVCTGDTVQLGVTFGTSVPSVCGTNPVGCSASLSATIGTGTAANTSSSYPAPYANYYNSAKHQFLFKASELNAVGITGGKIDQLDFNVTQIPFGALTAYHEYTINMGCTNATVLTNSWVSGLYNVYTPKNYNVVLGWNSHPFDNAFEWDGISNIIVEICFNEISLGTFFTNNCVSPYTATSFVSCHYIHIDGTPSCPDLSPTIGTFNLSNNRPNVKFRYCGGAPDSSKYTYSWFPPAGILNSDGQTTGAVVAGQTNYYVIVTDTLSGCLDTSYFNVAATSPVPLNIDAGSNVTICPGTPTTLTATGASQYSWSPPTALSSTNTAITIANPTTTITYTVTGTANCTTGPAKDSVTVAVLTGQTLDIDAGADQEVCGTTPFNLTAISSGGLAGNTYIWTFVSGTVADSIHNANSINAYVIPTAENINTYQINVTDTCGNTASDMVAITVYLNCKLKIPNIFTPNGDGVNDYFLVSGVGLKTYSATIFDRWGGKVYESNDVKQSWDGKNADDGTYYYVIKAESFAGKSFDEKGFLLRVAK